MLNMEPYSSKRLSKTMMVYFVDGYYCLIVPSVENNRFRDFWVHHEDSDLTILGFGCEVDNDAEAEEIALKNADGWMSELEELITNQYKNNPVMNQDTIDTIESQLDMYLHSKTPPARKGGSNFGVNVRTQPYYYRRLKLPH